MRTVVIELGRRKTEGALPGRMLIDRRWLRIAWLPDGLLASWAAALHTARETVSGVFGSRHR